MWLGAWCSTQPLAASRLPLPLVSLRRHSLPHQHLPRGTHEFLNRPGLFPHQGFAYIVPSMAVHTPSLPERCKTRSTPCSSCWEALQATTRGVRCSCLGPQSRLGIFLSMQYSTHHTGLGLASCLSPTSQLTGKCLKAGISSPPHCSPSAQQHRV